MTALVMRARQISCGHQKFVDDFTASEDERLFEKLRPLFPGERRVAVEPIRERAMFLLYL